MLTLLSLAFGTCGIAVFRFNFPHSMCNRKEEDNMPLPSVIAAAATDKFTALQNDNKTALAKIAVWRLGSEEALYKAVYQSVHSASEQKVRMVTATDAEHLDYGGWFNYFLEEAKNSLSDSEKGLLFFLAFDFVVADSQLKPSAVPTPMSPLLAALVQGAPGALPKAILQHLFSEGFEEAKMIDAASYFGASFGLSMNMTDPTVVAAGKVFAYRGDSREPNVVRQHGGAKCRVQLDFWRADNNLDALWHPWRENTDITDKMWFRKGSKDNDYFSLNSVAMDFNIACAYPIFRSNEKGPMFKGPVSSWKDDVRSKLAGKNVYISKALNTKTGKQEDVLVDIVNIYVYLLDSTLAVAATKGYNTISNYPESGVRNLSLDQILAVVKVFRYHHPPKLEHAFYDSSAADPSITVLPFSWSWFHSERSAQAALGATEEGVKALAAILDGHKRKCFDINHTRLVSVDGTYKNA
jgi:hypothetical protein